MAPLSCDQHRLHLSADLDGSLPAELQAALHAHEASCPDCAGLRESLEAQTQLLRRGMTARVARDAVDFARFTQGVMAKLPAAPAPSPSPAAQRTPVPLWTRLGHAGVSLWQTQRLGLVTGALAVALVAVLVPRVLVQERDSGVSVQSIYVDPAAHVAPVVMANGTEDTIIWLVDHDDHLSLADESAMPEWTDHPPLPKPSGGDL